MKSSLRQSKNSGLRWRKSLIPASPGSLKDGGRESEKRKRGRRERGRREGGGREKE